MSARREFASSWIRNGLEEPLRGAFYRFTSRDAEQSVEANSHLQDIDERRRVCPVPPTVQDEAST